VILRYNMPSLLKIFKSNKKDILLHLERRLSKGIMSRRDSSTLVEPLASFLLAEESYICYNNKLNENFRKGASIEERIVYLYLAGKRDFLEYKTKGIDHIPVEFSDLPIEKLKHNRLLDIRNNTINFNKVPTQ